MGSEIQDRAAQAQELRETQDAYRRRKQAVDAEGQEELQKARKENAQKLKDEMSSSEAAVNHVRVGTKDRLETLRDDGERKVTYERNALAKRYHNTIEHGEGQIGTLDEELATKQERLKANLKQVSEAQNDLRSKEAATNARIHKEQSEHRSKIAAGEQAEIVNLHNKATEQKTKINVEGRKEIERTSDENRSELSRLKATNRENYQKQREGIKEQLKLQTSENARRLDSARVEYNKNRLELDTKAREALAEKRASDNERLTKLETENSKQIDSARGKGVAGMEETRRYYDSNIAKVHKTGDEQLGREKETQEFRVRNLRLENQEDLGEIKANHKAEMTDLELAQKDEQERAKVMNKQTLIQQRHEYDTAFQKNLKAFEQTVKNQRHNLKQSLAREKREVIEDVGKYQSKRADPFYRLAQPAASIDETSEHYIVRAHIPEHEKENVKVTVHEEKVIVHGARRFEDRVDDSDVSIATNNYQTFRQEIPLEHPVRDKQMQKSWADGILTVKIPKA